MGFYTNLVVLRDQQNSVVEHKHQHLLNVARVLYFQSQVLVKFWSDCMLATTFLINVTPPLLLNHKTPYEILYKKAANYSSFRVFGCLAFVSTLTAHRNKFQPRARFCVFLGNPSGVKGYKLYDVASKHILSWDVVIHKTYSLFIQWWRLIT